MSSPIKNVLIAGAAGAVGTPILAGLLSEPSFNVTILSRASSSARFSDSIPVKRVSDDFTTEELTEAFRGQDAVVIALTTESVTKGGRDNLAYRLIDAAAAAGVKRFIPSEFAANNLDPRARKLVPVYDLKGDMLEYLIAKAKASNGTLTWSSISCGSWPDWALDPSKSANFLGIDVKARKASTYDSGNNRFAMTTSYNTGSAITKILLNADITANKQIFLSDFNASVRDIVDSLEKQTGEKWAFDEPKDSKAVIKVQWEKFEAGDFNATYPLIAISFVGDVEVGYNFERDQEVWNSKLGLPKVTLDEVVKEAIELAKRS